MQEAIERQGIWQTVGCLGLSLGAANDGDVVGLAPNTSTFWEDGETTVFIWGGFQELLMTLCRRLRRSYTRRSCSGAHAGGGGGRRGNSFRTFAAVANEKVDGQ